MLSHLVIDYAKLKFQKKKSKVKWFIIDQIAHLLVISFLAIYWLDKEHKLIDIIFSNRFITISTAIIFLTKPMSIIMNILLNPWTELLPDNKSISLKNAGKYIGMLERIMIFLFIYTNHWEAVGFLLATKSIFRFGDLKESNEIKLTEYILIGTLLSFGTAILVALATLYIVNL